MRPISGKQMIKILEARGWQYVRTRGSHHYYRHPESPELINVPVHGNQDLTPGSQRDTMRKAGLNDADL
jgi:predicted RNA binding protein YcfA (HicA-like mRNA interferase family)